MAFMKFQHIEDSRRGTVEDSALCVLLAPCSMGNSLRPHLSRRGPTAWRRVDGGPIALRCLQKTTLAAGHTEGCR